jgi:preprotein translocase SecE subunit
MSEVPKGPKPGSVPVPKLRRGVKGFYRDVIREMKHVTWPRPQETTRLTGVVLIVCAGIIVLLQLATFVFGKVVHAIVSGGA